MAIPSLAMIPSGYKDGKVYSVLPTNGDGDFTFSRGSNATRVNKDGLIETMPLGLGSELVTNGSFDTDSDWVKDAGWTISGGLLNCNSTITDNSRQLISDYSTSKVYLLTYTISNYVSGGVRFDLGYNNGEERNANGTYTEQLSFTDGGSFNGYLRIFSVGASQLSIDNVSIKEVISGLDLPRLDYSDSSCPSLLLEPQSTNLIEYSEDFSNAYWTKDGITVTSGFLSPDGSNNAFKLVGNGANSTHLLRKYIEATALTTHSFSFFVKKGEITKLGIREDAQTGNYVSFDLETKTIISQVVMTLTYEEVGDYLKIKITSLIGSNGTAGYAIYMLDDAYSGGVVNGSRVIPNGSGFYIYGAQLEELSYPTSYIPTNGSIATRLADVCNSAGTSDTFNDSEGVLYVEMSALANDGTARRMSVSDGSSSNNIFLGYRSTTNQVRAFISGSYDKTITISDTLTYNKLAIKYKSGDVSFWINGVELDTSTSSISISGLSTLNFDSGSGGNDFYGNVKDIRYYNTALTDAELEELTTL